MQKFMAMLAALVLFLPIAVQAQDAGQPAFEEGKHYQVLSQPVRTRDQSKIEVVELFWYGCPHCRDFEPMIKVWAKQLPDDVLFEQSPVAWSKELEAHAKAFFAAEAMGIEEEIRQPLFDALARDRKKLNDADSLAAFVKELGHDGEAFKKSYNSFGVRTKLDQALARARSYRATGVPAMVVNGKYRIDTSMAGSMANVLKVVNYLIEQERAAKTGS